MEALKITEEVIRENDFEHKKKKPGLGANRPLNNWAQVPGTGFQFLSVELGLWIPIVSGIPDSLICIPDSKTQDFGFHKQKFHGFRNPYSLNEVVEVEHNTLRVSG